MDVDRLTVEERNQLMKKEGASSVGTQDTGLTNAPKKKTTRRKARKCLRRR
jgi:hypothetical protein